MLEIPFTSGRPSASLPGASRAVLSIWCVFPKVEGLSGAARGDHSCLLVLMLEQSRSRRRRQAECRCTAAARVPAALVTGVAAPRFDPAMFADVAYFDLPMTQGERALFESVSSASRLVRNVSGFARS